MDIEVTMPDGVILEVTLPDGLSDSEIQKEVDGVEAAYLLDANPGYLSSGAVTEAEANAPLRLGKGVTVQMPLGQDDTQGEESPRITEEQRKMLEDARLQSTPSALAARDQQRSIEQARREALQEEGYTILPILREARVKGSNAEVDATLRDLASLPGKGYGAIKDLLVGDDPRVAMDKTSDELLSEGRVGRSILASPSLVPSTLAALYTGGMSIPTQIGAQVASNAIFMPEYGKGDATLDVALSALPAGASIIAGKVKSAGKAAIKKALTDKGIKNVSDDVLEKVYNSFAKKRLGGKIQQESSEKLARELAGPSRGQSDIPVTGMLRGLSPQAPVSIPSSAFDRARSAIMQSVKKKGGRSLEEAREAISRVDAVEANQAKIAALQMEGGYSPESYYRDITQELSKVSDIPEVISEAGMYLSNDAGTQGLRTARQALALSTGRPLPIDVIQQPSLSGPLQDMQVGATLKSIYGSDGRGVLDVLVEPAVSTKKVLDSPTAKFVTEGAIKGAGAISPSVLQRFYTQGDKK